MISVLQTVYLLQWELQAVLRLPARWDLYRDPVEIACFAHALNGGVLIDEHAAASLPGLYAAGDCTGGLLQVAKAVYEGAQAGINAGKYVRSLK